MIDPVNSNLKDYFFSMKQLFQEKNDLETLTELLSNNEFTETRPYFTRRKLTPKDQRFISIELVYETPELVRKIFWNFAVNVSRLSEYFGSPRYHYTPHGSATKIGFFDLRNQFSGFETIYPGQVKERDGKYEVVGENGNTELKDDLEASFVSFDIGYLIKQ